jgi:curved DNA-binding protein CbpA
MIKYYDNIMAEVMSVKKALSILEIYGSESFTRRIIKANRDYLFAEKKRDLEVYEQKLKDNPDLSDTIKAKITVVKKKMDDINEAYSILKSHHRTTHGSTAHNRFTNARKGTSKGVSGLLGRMRQGISGLASRMYTRRNGNGGASQGARASGASERESDAERSFAEARATAAAAARAYTAERESRRASARATASGSEETKGNESPYTKSRRESGRPYGYNSSRPEYFNRKRESNRNGTRSQGFTGRESKRNNAYENYRNYRNGTGSSHGFAGFSGFSGYTGTRQIFRTSTDKEIDEYLTVLGLPLKAESFTKDNIRTAFKAKSLQTHPNKNPNKTLNGQHKATQEFASVNNAHIELKKLLSSGHNYTPPQSGFMPSASPMHPKARTSPKSSRPASPKARPPSPKIGVQEKESHIMRLKKALGVLGLDPNERHSSGKILETFLANKDPSQDIEIAFTILYFNPKPEFGPPRTRDIVEAKIEERKKLLKKYKENI